MTDEYTRSVLARADRLRTGEAALTLLDSRGGRSPWLAAWRAALAAALAALATLVPAISAAQLLL